MIIKALENYRKYPPEPLSFTKHYAYFSEIFRLLRPGGTVLFTTPNAGLRLDPGMKPWNEFHVREFTPKELYDLLIGQFDVVEVRGLFGKDSLYRIEYNRLEKSRLAARVRRTFRWRMFKEFVVRNFPRTVSVRNYARKLIGGEKKSPVFDPSQAEQFSTRDLFYESNRLEAALDLLALCRKA